MLISLLRRRSWGGHPVGSTSAHPRRIGSDLFHDPWDRDEVDHSGEDLITIVDEEKQIFQLQGNAEFADVCKALKIEGKVSEDLLDDFNTFSGYLCSLAGEIPAISDYIVISN